MVEECEEMPSERLDRVIVSDGKKKFISVLAGIDSNIYLHGS